VSGYFLLYCRPVGVPDATMVPWMVVDFSGIVPLGTDTAEASILALRRARWIYGETLQPMTAIWEFVYAEPITVERWREYTSRLGGIYSA
jgi:hypothetical protein